MLCTRRNLINFFADCLQRLFSMRGNPADEILPGLWLGNRQASQDTDWLQREKITVVFNATYATATRGSVTHSFIYSQTETTAGSTGGYSLIDVVGVTLVGLETTASATNLSAFIA